MIVAGMILSTPLIFRRGFTWSVSDARSTENSPNIGSESRDPTMDPWVTSNSKLGLQLPCR